MDYSELKNHELLAVLKDLEYDDIRDIYDISRPSNILNKLMLTIMIILDQRPNVDKSRDACTSPDQFLASLKAINYKYLSCIHLKAMHPYTKCKHF